MLGSFGKCGSIAANNKNDQFLEVQGHPGPNFWEVLRPLTSTFVPSALHPVVGQVYSWRKTLTFPDVFDRIDCHPIPSLLQVYNTLQNRRLVIDDTSNSQGGAMYVIRQGKPQYDKLDSQVTLGDVCNSVQDV